MKISNGSIQQVDKSKPRNKCRSWKLSVHVDGKRRSKRFKGSVTDARAALEQWKLELSESVSNRLTFAQYVERYNALREQSGQYSANTNSATQTRLAAFVHSPLGDMRMDEITPADIEAAMLYVRDHAPRSGKLSGTSTNTYFITLHTLFKHAEATEQIARDPMRKLKPPKLDTRERDALSPLEIELLLNRLDDEPLSGEVIAVYLMLTLGLRRGEAIGAYASDFRNGVAHIQRAVNATTNRIGSTKSAAGVRDLPMPARLVHKLQEWTAYRADWGIGDALTMACMMNGQPMKSNHIQRWWTANRERFGCGDMVLHQLRHSNLSMMARVVPSAFDLQRWAGWSSIAPAKVYIHTDMDALTAAANAILPDKTRQKRTTQR